MSGSYFKNGALIESTRTTATAGATTTLSASDSTNQQFTGTLAQTVQLPDATTLGIGRRFRILNRSTGTVTVKYNDGTTTAATITGGNQADFVVISNGTTNGTWDVSSTSSSAGSLTGLTAYSTVVADGSGNTTTVGPGTTAGVALVSAGATADPTYGQLDVSLSAAVKNGLLPRNGGIGGETSTTTAGGSSSLTVDSNYMNVFTGSSTHTLTLPVATTLASGQEFCIVNRSSGSVTVQTSGSNSIQVMAGNTILIVTCTNTGGGTGTASWSWSYTDVNAAVLSIGRGGTGVSAVTSAPTASAWAGWDANSNLSANNLIDGYNTTVTSGGTLTLTVSSMYQQYFTGTSAHTMQLPVANTLVVGQQYQVVNLSTGAITVQSSGANTVATVLANTIVVFTCILASGTTAASWSASSTVYTGPLTADTFSGDGSTTAFTLSTSPGTVNNTMVFISGVYQPKSSYSVSTNTLTFGTAPPAGTSNIQVMCGTSITTGTGLATNTFSGDGSTTAFVLSSAPGTVDNTFVFIGGVYQQKSTYSLSGNTLTFSTAPGTGTSNIQIITGTTLVSAIASTTNTFSGDGSTTSFTCSSSPGAVENTLVFIAGVYQQKTTYSVSGTSITFTAAPPAGTNNIQVLVGTPVSIGTPSDATVTASKFVESNKTASYNLASTDLVVKFSGLSAGATATLPTALVAGLRFVIKNADPTYTVTINTTSSQTIDGRASGSIVLAAGCNDFIEVVADGSNWVIVGKKETAVLTNFVGQLTFGGAVTGYYPASTAHVTLTPGTWRISASWGITPNSITASVALALLTNSGIYHADGGNNTSTPTALTGIVAGVTNMQGLGCLASGNGSNGAETTYTLPPFLYTVSASETVYAVPEITTSGSGPGFTSAIMAERVW